MVEYELVKGQEKRINKKYDELTRKAKYLIKEGEIQKIKDKYKELLEKKKKGETDWIDEVEIEAYHEAIKNEMHELKKI